MYKERDEVKRAKYEEEIRNTPKEERIYIDESGIDEYLYREYGRAKRGEVVKGEISGKKYKRTNIAAGQCNGKIIAPVIYEGITDAAIFETWFENQLLNEARKGSVIIMDNAAFHRKTQLKALAQEKECRVLFLPAYSPDLNPIEKFWARLKKRLRKILPRYSSLDEALTASFQDC